MVFDSHKLYMNGYYGGFFTLLGDYREKPGG